MKCLNCKIEVVKFRGELWHLQFDEMKIGRYKQQTYILFKKVFIPRKNTFFVCREPKVSKELE